MSAPPKVQPRSLDELAQVIREALESADRAGIEYYRICGEALNEAKDCHFVGNSKGFWAWVERNFEVQKQQGTRWMDLSNEIKRLENRARTKSQPFESIADFERKRGTEPSGKRSPHRDYHAPVDKILDKVDTEALRREAERRRDELSQISELKAKIIDIGYKTLASKLHPDKGGSKNAMSLLNAARDGLRRHI